MSAEALHNLGTRIEAAVAFNEGRPIKLNPREIYETLLVGAARIRELEKQVEELKK